MQLSDHRLLARAAHLYYERDLGQPAVARRLGVSQATVSRLLRRARDVGIVRITVHPQGVWPAMEDRLAAQYGLTEVIVADVDERYETVDQAIGRAAAPVIEANLGSGEVVGLSSWSNTLLALAKAMHPRREKRARAVVQLLGGLGNPAAEVHAGQLTSRFSSLVGGDAHFLPAPGIAGSRALMEAYRREPFTRATCEKFTDVTVALLGIGAVEPSRLIAESGNVFSPAELATLQAAGAVGDVCMRFFREDGQPVGLELDERVMAIGLEELRRIPRRWGIAGGRKKHRAVKAALLGDWITHLVTDYATARWLLGHREDDETSGAAADPSGLPDRLGG